MRRTLDGRRIPKHTIASFIGASPAALEVKSHARRVAQNDSTVLLRGEIATGKELLAQAIHAADARGEAGGNRLAAAKMLRMSRAALYDRLARYPELDASKP